MALVKGTNCGFVSSAPSVDPNGTSDPIAGYQTAFKDVAPAGNNNVTELGWYESATTFTGAAYSMGIYSHDATGDGRPNALIATQSTGNSTTTDTSQWYKYSGLSIPVTGGTTYWIALAFPSTGANSRTDYTNSAGDQQNYDNGTGVAPNYLQTPWDGAAAQHSHVLYTFYALYEAAAGGLSIPVALANFRRRK
jgi:hypothetical protein